MDDSEVLDWLFSDLDELIDFEYDKERETMPKAILELEMPESCADCMFKECLSATTKVNVNRCLVIKRYCPQQGRRPDCPLKLADEHCRQEEYKEVEQDTEGCWFIEFKDGHKIIISGELYVKEVKRRMAGRPILVEAYWHDLRECRKRNRGVLCAGFEGGV